jgi:signal recognition particle receptor subunit beta
MYSGNSELESKIVVLGLSQSGKTSIRQVVFEGFAPEATSMNPATVRINRKLFNLAGSAINLFDVGGQSNYLNEVFEQYKERTFSDAKAFIFVVDVSDASNIMRSKYYFDLTMENAKQLSEGARIYVFAHKMDVVPPNKREPVLQSIKDIFEISNYPMADILPTSIFEETIWDAMQQVIAYVFPKDDTKSSKIKETFSQQDLVFLSLSTAQGLMLYSQPERYTGFNFVKLKNDLAKMFSPTLQLDYATFSFDENRVYMRELDQDLIITTVFPPQHSIDDEISYFMKLSTEMKELFQADELIGRARVKMTGTLVNYLAKNGIPKSEAIEKRIEMSVSFKCDVCGRNLQKSLIDVAVENSENLERGIKIQKGFGATSVEMFPLHECVEGIREIPIFLDGDLEYRRYDDSRPV